MIKTKERIKKHGEVYRFWEQKTPTLVVGDECDHCASNDQISRWMSWIQKGIFSDKKKR